MLGDEPAKFEHLAKLTYCTQVVKDNLRLIPPAQSFKKCSLLTMMSSSENTRFQPAAPCTSWSGRFTTIRSLGGAVYFRPDRFEGVESRKCSPFELPFQLWQPSAHCQQLSLEAGSDPFMEIEVKAMSEPFMDLKFWSARWSQRRIQLGKGPGNRLPQQETGGEDKVRGAS